MRIEILKWEIYNPRTDRKSRWFRVENDVLFDQKFFSFSAEEKLVWFYLLSFASKEEGKPFNLDLAYLCHHGKIKKASVLSAIQKLTDSNCIKILDDTNVTPRGVDLDTKMCPTYVRTNDTNVTYERQKLDFEALYKKYPRKLGKREGIQKCQRSVTSPDDYDKLSHAIDLFTAYHKTKKTEEKFIPYFSSFMTDWESWLDPTTGTVSPDIVPKKKSISEMILEEANGSKAV